MPGPSADTKAFQQSFFEQMGTCHQFQMLFSEIDEVFFFAKDREGRFVAASDATARRLQQDNPDNIIGATDQDHFPPHICDRFREDDLHVMETGEPIRNRIEIWYNEEHSLDWFMTTKYAIQSASGERIGVMGIVRDYREQSTIFRGYELVSPAVDYIRRHLGEPITIGTLAALCHVTERQLNRRFKATFGIGPKEFLIKSRLQAASHRLTHGKESLASIAADLGFPDQAAMSRHFRKHIGIPPNQYRIKYSDR